MRDVKQYFLAEDVDIALGIDRPKDPLESHTFYYDNCPIITLHDMNDRVMLAIITKDDNVSRRILMTPKQAKKLAKLLSKHLKKFAEKIEKK